MKNETTTDGRVSDKMNSMVGKINRLIFASIEYVDYEHDGDPWTEDARSMGEMELNEWKKEELIALKKDVDSLLSNDAISFQKGANNG